MNLRNLGSSIAGATLPPEIFWPRKGEASANAAMDQIFEIFPDKYPILLNDTSEGWTFGLSWPRHILEHIDLALQERAKTCYGLDLPQLANYLEVRRYGHIDFVFSMFHSRALLAPALAASRRGGRPLRGVIHVDAHHDLSESLLTAAAPSILSNTSFEIECRLNVSESVTRAIDCGFINKGNFLTAFCLGTSPGHLYHVFPDLLSAQFSLQPIHSSVKVGRISSSCDSLTFCDAPSLDTWSISESADLPDDLPKAIDGIWLDVDLDAFCNRFDGNSDRSGQVKCEDEVREMRVRIDKFLDSLSNASWLPHIEAVSVAASPAFFPSDLWDLAIPSVCEGIVNVICV